MGIVTKEGYERKREWAANRMAENRELTTLSEEQHDALEELCTFRHELYIDTQRGRPIYEQF